MFQLKKQDAVLAHINIRDEKHGDDSVLAMDLKITADLANSFLNQLAPGLMAALYQPEDAQAPLLDDGHAPVLRFPSLDPLVFNLNAVGTKFVIHGQTKADNIEFEAKIKKITLECKQGGTVAIMFKAQILPEALESGKLPPLLGADIKVSVSGGEVQTEDDSEE